MSQRKSTVPPTRKQSRSSRSGREGLIAREKTEKQSARKRTALDNRFHRTSFALNRTAPPRGYGRAARLLPRQTSLLGQSELQQP